MKGGSDIVSAIHCMRQAYEHFESFQREYPASKGAALMKNYNTKLEWVYKDLATHPFLPDVVRNGINKEWNSDVFAVPAISEQVALLAPEQRAFVERLIEAMLNGEEIQMIEK